MSPFPGVHSSGSRYQEFLSDTLNFFAISLQNGSICLQLFAWINYHLKRSDNRIGNDYSDYFAVRALICHVTDSMSVFLAETEHVCIFIPQSLVNVNSSNFSWNCLLLPHELLLRNTDMFEWQQWVGFSLKKFDLSLSCYGAISLHNVHACYKYSKIFILAWNLQLEPD